MDSSLVSEEFAMLLEQHAGILWKVAFTWCQQNADREDLAQEIRLQLWRAFATIEAGPFRPGCIESP
jgi:DNA-directed RNA polymerase specialized sigma24 family protein